MRTQVTPLATSFVTTIRVHRTLFTAVLAPLLLTGECILRLQVGRVAVKPGELQARLFSVCQTNSHVSWSCSTRLLHAQCVESGFGPGFMKFSLRELGLPVYIILPVDCQSD
jgi:hypothetical protein